MRTMDDVYHWLKERNWGLAQEFKQILENQCTCVEDWTDGTTHCQECGKIRK